MNLTLLRAAGLGLLAGAGWGVLARVWMRLISTDPEFTWSGTLLIIGLAALLGCGVGLVRTARLGGRSLWWTLAVVPGLVLFLSPGMLFLPFFLLGGLAFAGRGRVGTTVGGVVLAGMVAFGVWLAVSTRTPDETTGIVVNGIVGFSGLGVLLAWAGSHLWRRRVTRSVPAAVGPEGEGRLGQSASSPCSMA